jgi:hypothetical protein
MTELIVFADLEAAVVLYLKAALTDQGITATVATKVPKARPSQMVRISGTGGSRENQITDGSGVLVECWAPDEIAASYLARISRALVDDMEGWVNGVWIEDVGTSPPVAFPDPDVAAPRYQFTAQLFTLGEVIS